MWLQGWENRLKEQALRSIKDFSVTQLFVKGNSNKKPFVGRAENMNLERDGWVSNSLWARHMAIVDYAMKDEEKQFILEKDLKSHL